MSILLELPLHTRVFVELNNYSLIKYLDKTISSEL